MDHPPIAFICTFISLAIQVCSLCASGMILIKKFEERCPYVCVAVRRRKTSAGSSIQVSVEEGLAGVAQSPEAFGVPMKEEGKD
eukprot:1152801-Pelagomonas_calceolata.AAC.2